MTPLTQALDFYRKRESLDREVKLAAAKALGAHGVFSAAQIAKILDLPKKVVGPLIGKTDRTGGRLSPDALEPLSKVAQIRARGEVDVFAVREALDAGASRLMASRLTGMSESTIRRHYERAASMAAGEGE